MMNATVSSKLDYTSSVFGQQNSTKLALNHCSNRASRVPSVPSILMPEYLRSPSFRMPPGLLGFPLPLRLRHSALRGLNLPSVVDLMLRSPRLLHLSLNFLQYLQLRCSRRRPLLILRVKKRVKPSATKNSRAKYAVHPSTRRRHSTCICCTPVVLPLTLNIAATIGLVRNGSTGSTLNMASLASCVCIARHSSARMSFC